MMCFKCIKFISRDQADCLDILITRLTQLIDHFIHAGQSPTRCSGGTPKI